MFIVGEEDFGLPEIRGSGVVVFDRVPVPAYV